MSLQLKQQMMATKPSLEYLNQPGFKPIKEIRLFEHYGPVIPRQYHEETCPFPPLSSWIVVKHFFPLQTMIENNINGKMCDGLVVDINPLTRTYEVCYKKAKKVEYVSGYFIENHLYVGKLDKYPVGTKITKTFQSLDYYGVVASIDYKQRFFLVKYNGKN